MIPLFLNDVVGILVEVRDLSDQLGGSGATGQARLKEELRSEAVKVFERIEEVCRRFGLDTAADRALFIVSDLKGECTVEYLNHELSVFGQSLGADTGDKLFLYLPRPDAEFYDKEQLFEQGVYDSFPSARHDINQAGTALACHLYTACVFHLARAVEIGLRVLARDRGVRFPRRCPIELQVWEVIIRQLESRVGAAELAFPKSVGKNEFSEFYRTAIVELRAFKQWRDRAAHAREPFDPLEACGAFLHAREFMQKISRKLSENNTRPIRWKKKGGNLL
jgi:hypothetical protein